MDTPPLFERFISLLDEFSKIVHSHLYYHYSPLGDRDYYPEFYHWISGPYIFVWGGRKFDRDQDVGGTCIYQYKLYERVRTNEPCYKKMAEKTLTELYLSLQEVHEHALNLAVSSAQGDIESGQSNLLAAEERIREYEDKNK